MSTYIDDIILSQIKEQHELVRKKLWMKAACAYVNSSNSTDRNQAAAWADTVLYEFDNRFPSPE